MGADPSSDSRALECLLVARHARPDDPPLKEVAKRLCEAVADGRMRVVGATCSTRPEAVATFEALVSPEWDVVRLDQPSGGDGAGAFPVLGPGAIDAEDVRTRIDRGFAALREKAEPARRATVLMVGHQPAIDQLLARIVARQTVALAPGEVACLVRAAPPSSRGRWRLWWILSPSTAASTSDLRQKVQSKMTVVAVLAGFATALIGSVLVQLPDDETARAIAVGAAGGYGVAAALLVCALLAYDRLMMPPRFWPSNRPAKRGSPLRTWPVARPPSSIDWVLYQLAVRTWTWVVAALWLAWIATATLVVAAVWGVDASWKWPLAALVSTVPPTVAVAWWRSHRGHLGAED